MKGLQLSGLFSMVSLASLGLVVAMISIGAGPATAAAQSVSSQDLEDSSFFAGIVISIDPRAGVMTVKEAGSPRVLTFEIPAGAEIVKEEASIEIARIEVGDPVAIEYRESARGPRAASVKVITPPRED